MTYLILVLDLYIFIRFCTLYYIALHFSWFSFLAWFSCLVLSCPNSCYTLYSVAFVIVKLNPSNYRLGLGVVRVPSTAALLLAWRLLLDFGLASTGMCTLFHLGSLFAFRRHCHHHQINARTRCSVLYLPVRTDEWIIAYENRMSDRMYV